MKRIILIIALLLAASAGMNAERVVTHALKGSSVTLDLNWTDSNYGEIQWQSSADGGLTWTDIAGATSPAYIMTAREETLVRAVVKGDPACPPALLERLVKPVSFRISRGEVGPDYIDLSLRDFNLADSEIAEYGFAENLASLNRPFSAMNRVKVGDSFDPSKELTIRCSGLRNKTEYELRPWLRTTSGALIIGASLKATTSTGMQWYSEDWTIETDRIRPQVQVTGTLTGDVMMTITKPDGSTASGKCRVTRSGVYNYNLFTGLEPATDYKLTATATVNGSEMSIEKTVRTATDYSTYEVAGSSSRIKTSIRWNTASTLRTLSPEGWQVEYPRACRVDDNTILLSYHGGNTKNDDSQWHSCFVRTSHDNGETWGDPVAVFDQGSPFGANYWRIVNPEMTRLANGWIIFSAVGNGKPETNDNCHVFTCLSKDGGKTWGDPVIVGRGRTWEPQIVQLPGGELELLVSSEAKWWEPRADNICQEIVSARSTDNGETWTAFERASFKPGARDGMPVAVVQEGNRGVLFIIESVNGNVPPTLIHRNLTDKWNTADWDGSSSATRWKTALPTGAGAPYAIKMPNGDMLLTAHSDQSGSVWQTCRPRVTITSADGKSVSNVTAPLPVSVDLPAGTGAYYNSLFLKDEQTVWLLVTKARYEGDRRVESYVELLEGTITTRP